MGKIPTCKWIQDTMPNKIMVSGIWLKVYHLLCILHKTIAMNQTYLLLHTMLYIYQSITTKMYRLV